MPWSLLRKGWRRLPRAGRNNYLRAAAACLHERWRSHDDLAGASLNDLVFQTDQGPVRAMLRGLPPAPHAHPIAVAGLLEILADWHEQSAAEIGPRDRVVFFREFLSREGTDPESIRYGARRIAALARRRALGRAHALYRGSLSAPNSACWSPDPRVTADQLRQALVEVEADPRTHLIKSSSRIRVIRATLLGHDALIKRYDVHTLADRIKYRWRASRARRAWAAAHTMRTIGIPTPDPLGFAEVKQGRAVTQSYFITRFLPDASSVYRWLKVNYRRQTEEWKAGFRADLLRVFLAIYRAGLYHADTKLPNLLVRHADDAERREFYWTDLECVAAGVAPSRRKIVRNLIQMNGSLRYWVPEADRMKFLQDLAATFPWAKRPDVVERIRASSRRRLMREVRRHTPPDGWSGLGR
jgi:hypothetical protein